MKKIVLIVAGGSGQRMNSKLPKQFLLIRNKPILMHTIEKFYNYDNSIEIRLVLPISQIDAWEDLCDQNNFYIAHRIYTGGHTRFHSVKNGLKDIPENTLIAVHDGVRPLVSFETISNCFRKAEEAGVAIPIIDINDTIRKIHTSTSQTVNRSDYKIVQTPQVFKSEILVDAYQQDFSESFTDDASVAESKNYTVNLVNGNKENIKITTPDDIIYAEALLNSNS